MRYVPGILVACAWVFVAADGCAEVRSASELGADFCRSWQKARSEAQDGGVGQCIGEMADDFTTIANLILAKADPKEAKAALVDTPPLAAALARPCIEPTAIADGGTGSLEPDPYVDAGSKPAVQP